MCSSPHWTGRLELISQKKKIVSSERRTKAITVSGFPEKLSPANWAQGVTAISRKISCSWAPKKWVQHTTAIYPIPRYTRPRYIGSTLYQLTDTISCIMSVDVSSQTSYHVGVFVLCNASNIVHCGCHTNKLTPSARKLSRTIPWQPQQGINLMLS